MTPTVAPSSLLRLSRLMQFAVMSLIMATAAMDTARAQSVVNAFQAWQQIKCAGNVSCLANTYKIARRGTGHVVSGGELSAIARSVVDGANGYLMIDDEGTGGGNGVTEAAIFRMASGPALFVVATRIYETLQVLNGTIEVYRWHDNTLTQADGSFPKPEPQDFVPGADAGRGTGLSRSDSDWNETVFHLPRRGATIDAYLLRFDIDRCIEDDWLRQPRSARSASCKKAALEYRPNMTLTFDKVEGRFLRGALSTRKAPPLR